MSRIIVYINISLESAADPRLYKKKKVTHKRPSFLAPLLLFRRLPHALFLYASREMLDLGYASVAFRTIIPAAPHPDGDSHAPPRERTARSICSEASGV